MCIYSLRHLLSVSMADATLRKACTLKETMWKNASELVGQEILKS